MHWFTTNGNIGLLIKTFLLSGGTGIVSRRLAGKGLALVLVTI